MVSLLEYKYFLQANILSGNLVPQFHPFLHLCLAGLGGPLAGIGGDADLALGSGWAEQHLGSLESPSSLCVEVASRVQVV